MSKTATLDEFFEKDDKNTNSGDVVSHELKFTGNWFIDAGILGFVNLMEEVYGWDLEKLREKIKEDPELVYYGYFPFAYLYKWLKDRNEKVSESIIEQLVDELERLSFEDNRKLFEFVWSKFICKLFRDKWIESKIKVDDINKVSDKKGKIKPGYDDLKYIELLNKREKIINELLNNKNLKNEIKLILSKKKGGDIKKLSYEDLKRLITSLESGSITSSELKKMLTEFKKLNSELRSYLSKLWVSNTVESFKVSKENSRFYRIPVDSGFYKNFLFFNYSLGNLEQLESFYDAISFNLSRDVLNRIDKTINKFLPSKNEFSNIYYAELSSKIFKLEIPYLFVYLLCFVYAFTRFRGIGSVLFYSNDLNLTYEINKRLRVYQEKVKDQSSLFKITWREIIDVLVEYKSYWNLENMYIIKYSQLDNQTQEGVEYIGISKLQASILLEDPIRDALNINLQIDKDRWVWILEEFIKNKPLYDLISKHVFYCLREKNGKGINRKASLYALAIDTKIKENNRIELFSDEFFKGYRSLVNEIKYCYSTLNSNAIKISRVFDNEEERRQICYSLVSALKKKNRIAFVNTLLKKFLEIAGSEDVSQLNRFVFENIVSNDDSWENYGLALVIGILSFGGEDSGEESEEV